MIQFYQYPLDMTVRELEDHHPDPEAVYEVDEQALVDAIHALAERYPDRKVQCCYVSNAVPIDSPRLTPNVDRPLMPECIVGTALYGLGVPLELLARHNGASFRSLPGELAFNYERLPDTPTIGFIAMVQRAQDDGMTWGNAVYKAQREVYGPPA